MRSLSKQLSVCAPAAAPTGGKWRTARQIALALGVYKKAVHRKALREQWPVQKVGNRLLYRVPHSLRRRLGPSPQPAAGGTFPPAVPPVERARLLRAWFRFKAVCELENLIALRVPPERALLQVARIFRFRTSQSSLRKWQDAFRHGGFQGLQEHKAGRVGRKPSGTATRRGRVAA